MCISRSVFLLLVAGVAAFTISCTSAFAVPQGAFWVEIPVVDHPDDAIDLSGYRCFHLYVELEPGDTIFRADFGIAGPNGGIETTLPVFRHPFGNDMAPNDLLVGFAPDVFYNSHVALGDLDGAADEVITPVGPINWDPSGFVGAWSTVPNSPDAEPNNGNALWLAQVTVFNATEFGDTRMGLEYLGGEFYVSGNGPEGEFGGSVPATGVVSVGSAWPLSVAGPVPGPFQMLSPVCGAENLAPNNIVFEWEPSERVFEYSFGVTTDFRWLQNTGVGAGTTTTDTSYTVPANALQPCTTYFWRVRARGSHGETTMAGNWEYCLFTTSSLGDLNADGAVDTADLGQMIGVFQSDDPASDLNGDGVVDTADLGLLIANFGQSCD